MNSDVPEGAVVADMKVRADKYGLWDEVWGAYELHRKAGNEPVEAAWRALWDWDLDA